MNGFFSLSEGKILEWSSQFKLKNCELPVLEPFGDEIIPFLKRVSLVNCVNEANPIGERIFEVDKGTRILRRISDSYSDCCYRPFYRIDDAKQE
jgi:hypothetical protein